MNKPDMVEHRLGAATATYRRRVIMISALKALPTFQLALIASLLGELSLPLMLAGSTAVYLVALVVLFVTSPARHISPEAFLLHLNRMAPELEESAQLFARDPASLDLLQQLQRDKIAPHLEALLAAPKRWLPSAKPAWPLGVAALLLILALTLHLAGPLTLFKQAAGPDTATGAASVTEAKAVPSLLGADVTVTPPAYTALPASMSRSLDISALEGSEIAITARFSDPGAAYRLTPSLGEPLDFEHVNADVFTLRLTASSTFLYQFVQVKDGQETLLDGIHTLTVERDQKPAVRIIEPKSTTVEFAKNATPTFQLVAHISDDFAIASTQILASVAKGTGEAVKFRDEVFAFDQHGVGESQDEYVKNWDLHKIGMEPGDELYFSITATDNREPEPNTVKSATVIVRWLDDVETPLGAEGIVSDFVPEYFKSQRQIIIETERLIADKPVLDDTTFRQTSYGLGQAQSDLKQRYGQYLGDEFGEGPGDQLAAVSEASDDHDHGEEEHDDHEDERPEIGHDHGSESPGGRSLTGAAELIARFGHAHEDADIGPIARQDPKTLMKKAVSIMWQAELHLMLAEPEKALPFEYEALKFLKLAKQADRIYVKRLGFEPPPVTEERRLSGDLSEIGSYAAAIPPEERFSAEQSLVRKAFRVVNEKQRLTDDNRTTLQMMSRYFTAAAQERPAFIVHAANIEKMLIAETVTPENCGDCHGAVRAALWSLLTPPESPPVKGGGYYLGDDPLVLSGVKK
jgi:hypothetical protein